MTDIAILYFSGYGHTVKQAEALAEGAKSVSSTNVHVLRIDENGELPDGGWDTLKAAKAIVFGSPTYMGGPAWQFKKIADASSKPWFTQEWKNKIAGGFTTSATTNGDKGSTISYFVTFAMQHSMIWVGTGVMPANAKANGPDDAGWTGGMTGALAIAPSDASPEEGAAKGDIETAQLYGVRIAEMAAKLA